MKKAAISPGASAAVGSSSSSTVGSRSSSRSSSTRCLIPTGSVSTARVGIDRQAVRRAERAHARAGGRDVDRPAAARLAVEQHVLPHPQPLDQLEVLVHEADRRPSASTVPSSGAHRAVGDRREGRFAGAVFADQGVDLAGKQLEVDPVDGLHRAEAPAHAAQRQSGTCLNDASPSRVVGATILPATIAARSRVEHARSCSRRDDGFGVPEVGQPDPALFEAEYEVAAARLVRRGLLR